MFADAGVPPAPAGGGDAAGGGDCASADAAHPTAPTASVTISLTRTAYVPLLTRHTLGCAVGVTDSHT